MYTAKEAWSRDLAVFGEGKYHEYRIPGVVVTGRGTILCYYESRANLRDDWGRIDVTIRRSQDDGETWSSATVRLPADMGGTDGDTTNNPTAIVDGGTIHMIFHQNYARAFHIESRDDGATWSVPVEITNAFREFDYSWNCCATGPGHGIAMKSGRLIAPVWLANGKYEDPEGKRRAHNPSVAGAIYSDDHGSTWHAGKPIGGLTDGNETTVAELPDGGVLFNVRSRDRRLRRVLALSQDVAAGYDKVWLSEPLNDPMCFGSMDKMPDGSVAFVNCDVGIPDTKKPDQFQGEQGRNARINLTRAEYGARENLTVKVSSDKGQTWRTLTLVDPVAGYADIAVHGDDMYVFYEYGPWEMRVIRRLVLKKYRLEKA